jgi:hypothetical protein
MKLLHSFCMSCPAVFIMPEFLIRPLDVYTATMLKKIKSLHKFSLSLSRNERWICIAGMAIFHKLYTARKFHYKIKDLNLNVTGWRNETDQPRTARPRGALYGRDFSLCNVQARCGPGSLYQTAFKSIQSWGLECILCGPYKVTALVCLLVAGSWSLYC